MKYLWQTISAKKIMIGNKPFVMAIVKDSNTRREMEEPLAMIRNKSGILFDDHAGAILVIDAISTNILDANQIAADLYGWSVSELMQMTLNEISIEIPDFPIKGAEKGTAINFFSAHHRRADKTIRYVEISAKVLETPKKNLIYCFINDITDRNQIEKELRLSRTQLDFALEKSHIGWWRLNLQSGIAIRTLEHARIFGYDSTDSAWTFHTFLGHIIPEDRERVKRFLLNAKEENADWSFECRIFRTDGEERWIMVNGGFHENDSDDKQYISGIVMDITERKSAESTIRESKKRLDLALKAAHAGVWEWNLETGEYIWSDELQDLYGIEEPKPLPSFEFWKNSIHPEDRELTIEKITQAVLNENTINIEYRVRHPDGSLHWFMAVGQPLRNEDGKMIRYIGTLIDTTERRTLLESVRQSESDYRSLFENMLNGLAYCQMMYDGNSATDFIFLKVNPKFEELTSLKNITGKKVTQLIPGIRDTDPELFRVFDRVAQSGNPEHFDYFLEVLQQWLSISVYSPEQSHFIVLFDIITKRKQTEISLRESEYKFRTITEQMSEIVFVTDYSGIVKYISPSIEKVAGYRPDEVTGHTFLEFLHEDDIERATEKMKNAISNHHQSDIFELKYKKKNGLTIYSEIGVRYYHKENSNEFSGLIGVIRDISQRKKDEEEKKQLELQLQKAERLETIGRLTGSIAHEFNNLLTPILGYAELGMFKSTYRDINLEYFTAIMQAAERAKHLISQILTFTKEHESIPTVVRVQSIIEEALKLLRPSIPANITIEKQIDPECRNILIDPTKLHQVIVNLCTNAYQAIGKNGGTISIELHEIVPDSSMLKKLPALKSKSYLQLSITDTGIGMDEATMEHIFEPFFTTKSPDKGTGLGLSVVHGIISSYEGEITVESHPGVATSFRICLPVIDQQIGICTSDTLIPNGNGHILFVDDEQVILDMITRMLTKIGFSICAMKQPSKALEIVKMNPERFDLAITDLTMPEMSGIDFATELHKICSRIPIILMTGYGNNVQNTITLEKSGICKTLKKPVRFAELASNINEVLRKGYA